MTIGDELTGVSAKSIRSLPRHSRVNRTATGKRMADRLWDRLFQGRFEDPIVAIDVFKRHKEQVHRDVPADRLLVNEVRQEWGPLCDFLGAPVPEGKPFPHLIDAVVFRARIDRVASIMRTVGDVALELAAVVLIFIATVAIRLT